MSIFDTAFTAAAPAIYTNFGESATYYPYANKVLGTGIPCKVSIGASPMLRISTGDGTELAIEADIMVPVSVVALPATGDQIVVTTGQRAGTWKVATTKNFNGGQWMLACKRVLTSRPSAAGVRENHQ